MNLAYTWGSILVIVACTVCGDMLVSLAMKQVGDLGIFCRTHGLRSTLKNVALRPALWAGICFMALAFFALLLSLSWADVSLVAPASAALTFIGNAFVGKLFLRENVDLRRWLAALTVAAGVALLSR